MQETDFQTHVILCEFILKQHHRDENFWNTIWSDEAKFGKNDMMNKHDSHYRSREIVNNCLKKLFEIDNEKKLEKWHVQQKLFALLKGQQSTCY